MISSRLSTVSVVTKNCFAHAASLPGTSRSHMAITPTTASTAPPDASWFDAKTDCSDSNTVPPMSRSTMDQSRLTLGTRIGLT